MTGVRVFSEGERPIDIDWKNRIYNKLQEGKRYLLQTERKQDLQDNRERSEPVYMICEKKYPNYALFRDKKGHAECFQYGELRNMIEQEVEHE